jgi:hypothetical protein
MLMPNQVFSRRLLGSGRPGVIKGLADVVSESS